MKNCCFLILLLLSATFSGYSQKSYWKSFDITFSGGNNGGFSGNMATDVVCSIDAINGELDVAVNKIGAPWSVMWWYHASCWSKFFVFDQTNRYIEFRVKCNTVQLKPMSVNTWGGCDGCCAEKKTWPGNTFTIPEADVWTVIFLKVPNTTGGSQNINDTITNSLAWALENGNYSFDYVKLGLAAVPPAPTIDTKQFYYVAENSGEHFLTLSGISIPGRTIDGLTIKAEALSGDSIFQNVQIINYTTGKPFDVDEFNIATSIVQLSSAPGSVGKGDSIIITLEDTIRGTSLRQSFYVSVFYEALSDTRDNISVFPTITVDMVNINLPEAITGEINVADMVGNIVSSQKIAAAATAKVDLSAVAPGMYFIKISDGKNTITKKVVKE